MAARSRNHRTAARWGGGKHGTAHRQISRKKYGATGLRQALLHVAGDGAVLLSLRTHRPRDAVCGVPQLMPELRRPHKWVSPTAASVASCGRGEPASSLIIADSGP